MWATGQVGRHVLAWWSLRRCDRVDILAVVHALAPLMTAITPSISSLDRRAEGIKTLAADRGNVVLADDNPGHGTNSTARAQLAATRRSCLAGRVGALSR